MKGFIDGLLDFFVFEVVNYVRGGDITRAELKN
jgi:hypothetical protein